MVEGEKTADATRSLGVVTTALAHGSKSANKTDWSPLAGREVVILPEIPRNYIVQTARGLGCDPAFVGIGVLAAPGAAIGNSGHRRPGRQQLGEVLAVHDAIPVEVGLASAGD